MQYSRAIANQIAVVEVYLYHKTGVEVAVRPDLRTERILFAAAYSIAAKWVNDNQIKLTLLR
tara:strand:+ start:3229 stop:3414 length:186 start_codon:yes stop_codon:yes gene_type:complete